MDQAVLSWLLEEENPEVRLWTLKEYQKLPEDDEKVIGSRISGYDYNRKQGR